MTPKPAKLFAIGDNRDVSLDSRTFGPIDISSVVGKPLYIVRPLSRKGVVVH
jgi:type IV secretory pathway protease TraF